MRTLTTLVGLVALVAPALAQVNLNEIYASHAGTDDQEFIELIGTPGLALTNYMLIVVEGEDPVNGTLDRAFDLTGLSIQGDGYFVAGNTAVGVSFPGQLDLDFGTDNILENGAQTYYLFLANSAVDVASVQGLIGSNVLNFGTTTILPSFGTILDSVGVEGADGSGGDVIYDGALVIGPDIAGFDLLGGSVIPVTPAGYYRGGDFPGQWCCDIYLDFDDVANANMPRTPGAANTATFCTCPWTDLGLGKAGSDLNGDMAMLPETPFLTGTGTFTAGSANTLDLYNAFPSVTTNLFIGLFAINAPFKGGTLVPATGFLLLSFPVGVDGEFHLPFVWPAGIPAGINLFWQHWVQDPGATQNLSASNGSRSTTF